MKSIRFFLLVVCAALVGALNARGQWVTQSFDLVPGWNAIYLHVDPSHASLSELTADSSNPITEVWLWHATVPTGQSVRPPSPTGVDTQWKSWTKALGPSSILQRVFGNSACLVRVGGSAAYTWRVKGKPVPPAYSWTSSGLNFIGLPSIPVAPPSFDRYLSPYFKLYDSIQVYRYVGGDISGSNPALLADYLATPLRRGEAFWLTSTDPNEYNDYYGPFDLELQNANGVVLGDNVSQFRIILKNRVGYALTVKLKAVDSELSPQNAVVPAPPVLIRGALNTTNFTFAYSELNTEKSWTLAPVGTDGSQVEIVLGVNRALLTGPAGTSYGGILRFTDNQLLSQVDLPVSATVSSNSGLWVGGAAITQVQHYLKTYQKDAEGNPATTDDGSYILSGLNTSLGSVPKAFPLRLILHNDGVSTRLLQRVYTGTRFGNVALTLTEGLLDSTNKANARRISAAHLPWSAGNTSWPMAGSFALDGNVTATVVVSHADQSSNPFLHTYHPDHDNFDALFSAPLSQGEESYLITRNIKLSLTAPTDDFTTLTSVNTTRCGTYDETITLSGKTKTTGTESKQFAVRGYFSLNRVSSIATLTTAP